MSLLFYLKMGITIFKLKILHWNIIFWYFVYTYLRFCRILNLYERMTQNDVTFPKCFTIILSSINKRILNSLRAGLKGLTQLGVMWKTIEFWMIFLMIMVMTYLISLYIRIQMNFFSILPGIASYMCIGKKGYVFCKAYIYWKGNKDQGLFKRRYVNKVDEAQKLML